MEEKSINGAMVEASSESYVRKTDCKHNAERNMVKVNIEE